MIFINPAFCNLLLFFEMLLALEKSLIHSIAKTLFDKQNVHAKTNKQLFRYFFIFKTPGYGNIVSKLIIYIKADVFISSYYHF